MKQPKKGRPFLFGKRMTKEIRTRFDDADWEAIMANGGSTWLRTVALKALAKEKAKGKVEGGDV